MPMSRRATDDVAPDARDALVSSRGDLRRSADPLAQGAWNWKTDSHRRTDQTSHQNWHADDGRNHDPRAGVVDYRRVEHRELDGQHADRPFDCCAHYDDSDLWNPRSA